MRKPDCPFCTKYPTVAEGTTAGGERVRYCGGCLGQAQHYRTVANIVMDDGSPPPRRLDYRPLDLKATPREPQPATPRTEP